MNYNYMEYDQSIEANIKVNYGLKLNKITRQRERRAPSQGARIENHVPADVGW